jgi:hypothetical protein
MNTITIQKTLFLAIFNLQLQSWKATILEQKIMEQVSRRDYMGAITMKKASALFFMHVSICCEEETYPVEQQNEVVVRHKCFLCQSFNK